MHCYNWGAIVVSMVTLIRKWCSQQTSIVTINFWSLEIALLILGIQKLCANLEIGQDVPTSRGISAQLCKKTGMVAWYLEAFSPAVLSDKRWGEKV